jgi:flagellar protein FliO/FliZ
MTETLTTTLTAVVALAGILGVILLIGRALRYISPARPVSAAKLLVLRDSIALDTRRRLHLVQQGDRMVLLLTGGERDLVVGWLDRPPAP